MQIGVTTLKILADAGDSQAKAALSQGFTKALKGRMYDQFTILGIGRRLDSNSDIYCSIYGKHHRGW